MVVILDSDQVYITEAQPLTIFGRKVEKDKKMEITCFNCNQTWEVPQAHILGAKLKFALGFDEHGFICPNCDTKNVITKQDFEVAMKAPQPAAPGGDVKPAGGIVGKSGRAKPVTGPGPALSGRQRQGVVIVRSLHVRKDHSTKAETVAGLVRGDKVTILNTWTDGENTWAQLGPDRWAAIEHNGEALIELTDE